VLSIYQGIIDANFELSIPGPPSREAYIIDLSCRDAKSSYRSNLIEIGGGMATDLGHIVLERQ
jgi:hypothetical protein